MTAKIKLIHSLNAKAVDFFGENYLILRKYYLILVFFDIMMKVLII